MGIRFTRSLLILLLSGFFAIGTINISAQACDTPAGLSTSNLSNFSTTLNWTLDTNVDHYRLRYREIGTSSWLFEHNATGTSEDITV